MRKTRLVKRGGQYYYRAGVPSELLQRYKPKRDEFRFSLRTGDRAIAKRRVLDKSIRMLQRAAHCATHRAMPVSPDGRGVPFRVCW